MIKSMTGYGKGEASSAIGRFMVEIRSVNHRYGEISIRIPRQFQAFEIEIKKQVSAVLKRGKIDISVQWEETAGISMIPAINHELAAGYFESFSNLAKKLGIVESVPLPLIIAQKGVLQESPVSYDEVELLPLLQEATGNAISSIDSMRCREGEVLLNDLNMRKSEIERTVDSIREAVPTMVHDFRLKLTARLEQLLGDSKLDADRLTQEIALMADRSDVTEEIVRLNSHFKQWDQTLRQSEPVGRKLDFLMQEMNREINTIGSKANDSSIATLVIHGKAEMEKMREQVQNIE